MNENVYLCIDLKTFYASVECAERGLDPFSTNLVVADPTRGEGTICLAISPRMKMLGIKNRCRIFDIPKEVKYIIAKPRMSKYIEYSANIYAIYLKYISKDDIHVYSVDEAFLDVTHYLKLYNLKSIELARLIMKDIFDNFKITATCGIGTNLYLAKIALDIMSKHTATNIGWLTEEKYKKELWHHKPLSDFWQIGHGIEKRLAKYRIYDMYDIAHTNPKILYKEFGVNAEFLIDHSFGREKCTIQDIKKYNPKNTSISTNQVLFEDYTFEKARIVLKEMVELKSVELIEKNLVTNSLSLYIGYSKDIIPSCFKSMQLSEKTNVYSILINNFLKLYDVNVNHNYMIRRLGISFNKVLPGDNFSQLNLFVNQEKIEKERKLENIVALLRKEYGKNQILRGINFEDGATTRARNLQIGGHNAF